MIKEAYVSFEVAKLLKDKGFGIEEETRGYYPIKGDAVGRLMFGAEYHHNTSQVQISAPTHQMAMAWLREVHNTNIDIVSVWNQKLFEYQVFVVTPENAKHCYIDDKLYLTYEVAVEAGIKYSLENLI